MKDWTIVYHWTAGTWTASVEDKEHYHAISEGSGNIVYGDHTPEDNISTSDKIYGAHVLHFNEKCIGVASAGMHGAKESPLDFGKYPVTETSFEEACRLMAAYCVEYNIPVVINRVMTHAEVQPVMGIKQRGKWDYTVLEFRPDLLGHREIGDYMRERVSHYLSEMGSSVSHLLRDDDIPANRPTIREGERGFAVKEWQYDLEQLRYFSGSIDGVFGRLTKASTVQFQVDHGLTPDGIVGPRTWAAAAAAHPRPDREVDKQALRKNSRVMKSQDQIDGGVYIAEAGNIADSAMEAQSTITAALDKASGVVGQVEGLSDRVTDLVDSGKPIMAMAAQMWSQDAVKLVLGLLVGAAILYYTYNARRARVEDEVTGKTMTPMVTK